MLATEVFASQIDIITHHCICIRTFSFLEAHKWCYFTSTKVNHEALYHGAYVGGCKCTTHAMYLGLWKMIFKIVHQKNNQLNYYSFRCHWCHSYGWHTGVVCKTPVRYDIQLLTRTWWILDHSMSDGLYSRRCLLLYTSISNTLGCQDTAKTS